MWKHNFRESVVIIPKKLCRIKSCPNNEFSLIPYFSVFGMIPDIYALRKCPYSNKVNYRTDRTRCSKLVFTVIQSQNKTFIGLFTISGKWFIVKNSFHIFPGKLILLRVRKNFVRYDEWVLFVNIKTLYKNKVFLRKFL